MDNVAVTEYGSVAGFAQGGVRMWRGIPYARPPVGDGRFRRARPCEPWAGVKDCRRFGDRPVQFLPYARGKAGESEDCLYLNVWRPDDDRTDLPVFVWIYGGGFAFGGGDDPGYDGAAFARDGCVFVSFNYRLGPLGVYPLALFAPQDFDTNCTLSDQLAALKWVRDNIAAFGGDPHNVTVAGESAGGSSVCYLLASPAARGLFQKAIVQSGIPAFTFTRDTAAKQMELFLRLLGLDKSGAARLCDLPAAAMKRAAKKMFTETSVAYPGMGQPGPVFDDLLPELATSAVARGSAADVKLLIGTNRREGSLFYFLRWFIRSWPQAESMCRAGGCEAALEKMRVLYAAEKGRRGAFAAMVTDRLFLKDSLLLADGQSKFNEVYVYRFDYAPRLMRAARLGATHSCEIAPALGTMDAKGTIVNLPWLGTPRRVKAAFARKLHTAWVNFARSGDPNDREPPFDCAWEQYAADRRTLIIDKTDRIASDPDRDHFDVWNGLEIYQ